MKCKGNDLIECGKIVQYINLEGTISHMAETTITRDEVAHVAGLAKLAFNDTELDQFTTQLSDILNIFDTLSEVNTDNVEPTYSVTETVNHLRDDVANNWGQKQELLENAPLAAAGLIKVPVILDGEGE